MKSYIPIDVWQHHSDGVLVCYRCFRVIPDDRFCIQSADIFHAPVSRNALDDSKGQFFELLGEEKPDERSPTFDTIEQAIENHLLEFGPIGGVSRE